MQSTLSICESTSVEYFALSNSYTSELLQCPRKYQLSPHSIEQRTEISSNISLAFGSVYGLGIAEYMHSKNLEDAILLTFAKWPFALDETQAHTGRNVWNIVHALQDLHRFGILDDHEPLCIDGKTDWREVSFAMVDSRCLYAGAIDQAFIVDGIPTVVDYKTGGQSPDILEMQYSNQDQLLAYAVMFGAYYNIPKIAYEYILYSIPSGTFRKIKKLVTRELASEWMASVYSRFSMLRFFDSLPKAPKNGRSCFAYNRPCQFYGLCDELPKAPQPKEIPHYYKTVTFSDVKEWIARCPDEEFRWDF